MKHRCSFSQRNRILVSAVVTFLLLVVLSLVPMACSADAQSEVELSTGGSVYVSAYSKIFAGPKGVTVSLTSLLSIRNTDSKFPITILRMDYYDSEGRLIRSFIEKPIQVRPLGSIHYYLNQHTEGGPGAKFIVTWCSQEPVNKPIIESLMSDRSGTQGISFRCPGREITEHGE